MHLVQWAVSLAIFSCARLVAAYDEMVSISYFYKSVDPEDFLLGLIVPVHAEPNLTDPLRCGKILEQEGIQRVEMALKTVHEINARQDILPNTTLGIHIRDSCNYPPIALEQTINYIRASVWHDSDYQETPYPWSQSHSIETYSLKKCTVPEKRRNLISVLGPATCTGTTQVQNLLQLFGIPQIGYSATAKIATEYSKYFLSIIPNDDYQSQAMLDILIRFNWTYVYTIYSDDDDYGPGGIERFKAKAYSNGICVAQKYVLSPRSRQSDYETTVRKMMNAVRPTGARVIVAYLEKTILMRFLHTLKYLNASQKFLILASDSWGTDPSIVQSLEDVAEGCMTLSFPHPLDSHFKEYFKKLRPESNTYNPWFREFWEDRFRCTLAGRKDSPKVLKYHRWCTGNETLSDDTYREDPKLDYLRRSIYLVAEGLHRMIEDHCSENKTEECVSKMHLNASAFVAYLNQTTFPWPPLAANATETIRVNPVGVYNIYNFRKVKERSYDYVQIGTWKNGLQLWEDPVFKGGSRNLPESICSKPCEKGQIKSVWWPGDCCWKCLSCKQTQFIRDEFTCEECPKGFAPNVNLTGCYAIPEEYIHWDDSPALLVIAVATVGIATTCVVTLIFIQHNSTPVVKSSTRELSYIILVGMAMSHGTSLAFLFKPSDYSCFAVRVLPPFSLTMIYAPLLVKTVRIARILGNIRSMAISPPRRFLSSTSQVVITCILIFIQVIILTCTHLILPSGWEHDYPHWNRVVLQCRMPHFSIMLPLAFNFLLIILCTAYAVKTRNVPENFNEAKLIGFTMYATVVIWISFLAIYFGSPYKSVAFALSLSSTAHVALTLMFFHKVYIIVFHPEKNQPSVFRQLTDNMRMHIGAQDSSSFKSSIYNTGDSPSPISRGTTKLRPEKKRYSHSSSTKKKIGEHMRKTSAVKLTQNLDRRLSRTPNSDPAFSLNRFIDDQVNTAGCGGVSPLSSHAIVSTQSSGEQDGIYANSMSRFNQFDSDNNSVTNSENLDTQKSANSENTYESVIPVQRKTSRAYPTCYLPQTPDADRPRDFTRSYRLSVDQGQPTSSRFKTVSESGELSEPEQTVSEGHEKKPRFKKKEDASLQLTSSKQSRAHGHDEMEKRRFHHEPFRYDWFYNQPYPSKLSHRSVLGKDKDNPVRKSPGQKRSLDHTRDQERNRNRFFAHRLSLDQGIGLHRDIASRDSMAEVLKKNGSSTPKRRVSCERCTPPEDCADEEQQSQQQQQQQQNAFGLGDMMLIDDSSEDETPLKTE